ncbi:type II toxin-antitoxin system RatA family toxin [Accumulibacter sp.]|uniref:type II toxin-antitoxin system RatA family toxin n=1 Tax=Accumulibacter sp. TaxID=2053492 RepID=UPI0028784F37|nr:type II toxin-antitoxin system RatA family toxin [Accumulibacter sp.]MDS4053611.1 type II toxin-antitoxin system RatA family toxin [Accumulibacter sp.]
MAIHRERRAVAQPAETFFDVVADVERYPEFLPTIRRARIVSRHAQGYETEQSLAVGWLIHHFRTRTELDRPHAIHVSSDDHSFCHFDLRWSFAPLTDERCQVDFVLDCEMRSFFLMPVIQMLLLPMASGMVSAFEARAQRLASQRLGGGRQA